MTKFMLTLALVLIGNSAFAAPPIVDNVTNRIKSAEAKYGVPNFKMVMPGVLYRGGSGKEVAMTAGQAQALCQDGFDSAVYVYSKNWSGGDKTISCGGNQLSYVMRNWDSPTKVHDVLKNLRDIIQEGKGAMYVHCWYGVHASGYVVTVALRQFCGLSAERAVDYWNSNVAKTIQYPKVQQMVRDFKPYSDLQISAEQQARVCPKGI